jgi:hypothetical protein
MDNIDVVVLQPNECYATGPDPAAHNSASATPPGAGIDESLETERRKVSITNCGVLNRGTFVDRGSAPNHRVDASHRASVLTGCQNSCLILSFHRHCELSMCNPVLLFFMLHDPAAFVFPCTVCRLAQP